MPTQLDFDKIIKKFNKNEERGDLYPVFIQMINNGYGYEACVFMLSTWNFAAFRYVIRKFNFKDFEKTIKKLIPKFKKFESKKIKNADLFLYEHDIKNIFNILYSIGGVKSTGASKLMHLFAPDFFVMWDGYIRKFYKLRKGDANDYFNFLLKMQSEFAKLKFNSKKITFAKAIDQYNYVKFTLPGLAKVKRKKNNKKH